ncbi:MAG: helix-turn-helix transcriptional regulator [Mycolicibacter algericus]|uniref:helix-turn-helix domain-containing protein n=1 Tax=Mycolicibacter algericus TaxID=1288388 RepID=UPI003C7065E5
MTADYRWHLRRLMAERGLFNTTALRPRLAERGVQLSASQVYRLVTEKPERLSLPTLVALVDILGCTMDELIEIVPATAASAKKAAGTLEPRKPVRTRELGGHRPVRAKIVDSDS